MHITILFLYVYETALLKVSFLLLLGYLQRSKSTQAKSPLGEENNFFLEEPQRQGRGKQNAWRNGGK